MMTTINHGGTISTSMNQLIVIHVMLTQNRSLHRVVECAKIENLPRVIIKHVWDDYKNKVKTQNCGIFWSFSFSLSMRIVICWVFCHCRLTVSDDKYRYDIKFCESVAGQAKDVGVLQTVVKNGSASFVVGRITTTHIKSGSKWRWNINYGNQLPYLNSSQCYFYIIW